MAAPMNAARFLSKLPKTKNCIVFRRFLQASNVRSNEGKFYSTATSCGHIGSNLNESNLPRQEHVGDLANRLNSAPDSSSASGSVAGVLKAAQMFEKVDQEGRTGASPVVDNRSFATLLRHSKLIQLGDPEGRIVVGTIIEQTETDLYVDFGGKFYCVCKKPKHKPRDYNRGVKVRVMLKDLEMSDSFLGATRDITLLEADGTLLGLYRPQDIKQEAVKS